MTKKTELISEWWIVLFEEPILASVTRIDGCVFVMRSLVTDASSRDPCGKFVGRHHDWMHLLH